MIRPRSIAISTAVLLFLLVSASLCLGQQKAGVVTHLSGPLIAKKADGTARVLSINSTVDRGDLLITEKKTYARVKFTDGGEVVLRPNTHFRISEYSFDQDTPKNDRAVFNLFKGGLRSITGLIGKRADQDSYKLVTDTAVTGVRGTTYECRICEGNCGSIPDGLYLYVIEGLIIVSNSAGSQNISAGQYAYVQNVNVAPKILPANPGIDFTIPTVTGGEQTQRGGATGDGGCIVR